jgi:hypothetical protein
MKATNACQACGCALHECECIARTPDCLLRKAESEVSDELGFPVQLGDRKWSAKIILKYLNYRK